MPNQIAAEVIRVTLKLLEEFSCLVTVGRVNTLALYNRVYCLWFFLNSFMVASTSQVLRLQASLEVLLMKYILQIIVYSMNFFPMRFSILLEKGMRK